VSSPLWCELHRISADAVCVKMDPYSPGDQPYSMGKSPRRGIGWRFVFWAFLVGLAWSSNIRLHAQGTYTSTPGQTSIYSNYNPNAPAIKAPAAATQSAQPFLPTVPMAQYLAQKTQMAQYSQANFSVPSRLEVSPEGPRAPTAPGPLVSTPTLSWQGLATDPSLQPPTPDIAVGPSDVLMVINSTIAQFTRSGTLVKSNSFQDWFNDVLSANCPNCLVYDPWIVYDQLHGHFLFLASAAPVSVSSRSYSFLLLSVSKGATYGGGWKNWAMNDSLEGGVQTQFFGDSWRLGFDNEAIYLSGNMFDVTDTFQYAKLRVLKKSDVYNPAATTLPFQEIGSSTAKLKNANGSLADSLVPIRQRGMPTAAGVGLFASATTFIPMGSFANFLTVWKIADPLATPLTMTQYNITGVIPYNIPASAPQLASEDTFSTGDSRMLKLIYRNGFLYTARNSGYADQATTVTLDVINTSTMTLASQARLLNTNAFYPAFDVPATTPLGAPFAAANLVTGTTTAPNGTVTYAGLSNCWGCPGGSVNLIAGQSRYENLNFCTPCRWGDYFGGAVDPVSGGLWVSGEYAQPPQANGLGQSGTWVAYYPWLTTPTFTDVPSSSSFSDFINVLNSWQITTGCSPTTFCPTDMVTRDQFATFIIRSMIGSSFPYTATPYFTDVPAFVPVLSLHPETG
jgi:hypothetical protein